MFRAWPLCVAVSFLVSFACGPDAVPAAETAAREELARTEQALDEVPACGFDTHRDRLAWSSRFARDEACLGVFSYVREHHCRKPCGTRCISRKPCGDWAFGSQRGADHNVSVTTTLDGLAQTCPGIGGLCFAQSPTALTACQSAANRDMAGRLGRSPHPGRFTSAAAVSEIVKTTSRLFKAKCRYAMAIPQPLIRSNDGRCPCSSEIQLTCDQVCSTSRATIAAGKTRAEAEAEMLLDPEHALFDPIESIDRTELACSTCDELPLPGRPEHYPIDPNFDGVDAFDKVQAKYTCLQTRRALFAPGDPARDAIDRARIWVYEGWGDDLTEPQRSEVYGLYGRIDELPGVNYCAPVTDAPDLPATCTAAAASSLTADLRRCQRLGGEHAHPLLQSDEYGKCLEAYQRMKSTPGCQSDAWAEAMGEALLAIEAVNLLIRPHWLEPQHGAPTSAAKVQGERWVKETVVGAAPRGFTCPAPEAGSGWVGGMMFGERTLAEQPLGEDGSIFCRYDYTGPEANLDWLKLPTQFTRCVSTGHICSGLGEVEGPEWLHPDARVAGAQAPGVLAQIQARLAREYLADMDAPLSGGAVRDEHKVDLAILDSIGDSGPGDVMPLPGGGHGRALAMAAFRSACPDGAGASCPINLRMYQAFEPDTFASLSELATEIVRAVDAAQLSGLHLVINISLGLHPRFAWWDQPGENPDAPAGVMLPAFAALKAALNYASAHGAITVAAAGNTDGEGAVIEGDADELLYPAAFDGASGWACDPLRACTPEARSLVIAAGGVTARNQPLPNARFATHPVSLVAPACNVAVDNVLPDEATQPSLPTYCGTSFGAIGVSTVLAATWAYLPNATPDQLLHVVRTAGVNIASGTSGCTGDGCRVRLCASLRAAGASVTCRDAAPEGVAPPVTGTEQFIQAHEVPVTWAGEGDQSTVDAACGSEVVHSEAGARNEDACPARSFTTTVSDSETLVDCPGDPACPQCGIMFRSGPFGLIQPVLVGATERTPHQITNPSLELDATIYEMEATLGDFLRNGGSFAIPLALQAPSQTLSDVATLSYVRKAPSKRPTLQVDPVAVVR
jgi:hypothetical protein